MLVRHAIAVSLQVVVAKNNVLDFSILNHYVLTLMAVDTGTPPLNTTVNIVINLIRVNKPPVYSPQTRIVVKNDPAGTFIGAPVTAYYREALYGLSLTYNLTAGTNSALTFFALHPLTAQLYLTRKMNVVGTVFEMTAVASDAFGGTSTATITVTIEESNSRPVINNANTARAVAPGYVGSVAPALNVTDEDNNATYTQGMTVALLSVTPTVGAAYFAVDGSGNIITTSSAIAYQCPRLNPLPGCPLLYRSYSLSLSASDWGVGNLTAYATVVVSVLDVPPPPVVPAAVTLCVPENSAPGTTVVQCNGSYPDFYSDGKQPLAFTLAALAPSSAFTVSAGNRSLLMPFANAGLFNTLLNQYPPNQSPGLCDALCAAVCVTCHAICVSCVLQCLLLAEFHLTLKLGTVTR
jgi:hypothetical protein